MTKVFVLQAQGFGDNEYEFYNIGVFSSMERVKEEMRTVQAECGSDDYRVQFIIEDYEVK